MPSSNKPPITLAADTWTPIAPVGFLSITVQILNGKGIQYATGASIPTIAESGLLESRPNPFTISDSDATSGLWARPLVQGDTAIVRVN